MYYWGSKWHAPMFPGWSALWHPWRWISRVSEYRVQSTAGWGPSWLTHCLIPRCTWSTQSCDVPQNLLGSTLSCHPYLWHTWVVIRLPLCGGCGPGRRLPVTYICTYCRVEWRLGITRAKTSLVLQAWVWGGRPQACSGIAKHGEWKDGSGKSTND